MADKIEVKVAVNPESIVFQYVNFADNRTAEHTIDLEGLINLANLADGEQAETQLLLWLVQAQISNQTRFFEKQATEQAARIRAQSDPAHVSAQAEALIQAMKLAAGK